ncbi:2-C-methyl-D-erythritol 4-phosphate cytidylyltransferase [Pedobacter sp. HMF7647]|uniref:2-C-methyl-D-erythritol 4-phosphate cytidylyltransferase n=1 Tax=Hufsiella arboris TaxID=2695275 RepID=A0A7K1YCB2_9SPHI|nr:2-C-methyl-D-erythritol 4-phosphate cytidylyltransferase [Hufsiella arboris]MXV52205.1 2-C-methyl-D-erythritol 4-phosphate cytidylyltransferase [Hufsiella arboris]
MSQLQIKDENYYAIIVAGGSGNRMNSDVPKQFMLLDGKPIAMHTMQAFYESSFKPEIILVLPGTSHVYWTALCEQYEFKIPHQLANGGKTRFDSVKSALEKIVGDGIIAIHDAVRPLISTEIITKAYDTALKKGTAVTAVKSKDSVRQLVNGLSKALDREQIYLVQTPQVFRSNILSDAYKQPYDELFTDDASVVEKAGHRIELIEGDNQNIKITYPEDLEMAHAILKTRKVRA